MSKPVITQRAWLPLVIVAAGMTLGSPIAQAGPAPQQAKGYIEEVVVLGRLRSSATDVVVERLESEVVVDLLSAEDISRVGDSNVASALRRVPGLTLVNNQFVYVRGLGERYSSAILNGAQVPSPDLTRNVLPLDIFPTNILDSLAVQKGYSTDMPAAFGGGNIDIRTKGIPNDRFLSINAGSGWNFGLDDDQIFYNGGDDDFWGSDDGGRALSRDIKDAISTYKGDISPANIFIELQKDGNFHTFDEAEAINRELATALNRDIGLNRRDVDPDLKFDLAAGDNMFFGDTESWEAGLIAIGSYENKWRDRTRVTRSVTDPVNDTFRTERTVQRVSMTGATEAGLRWEDEQYVKATYMYIRNTDDEASLSIGNNDNFQRDSGQQLRTVGQRYEERELSVFQLGGEHELGAATLELFDRLPFDLVPFELDVLEGLRFEWYYSDSTAKTSIPNENRTSLSDTVDPVTGEVLATSVRTTGSAGDFRFLDLDDEVESSGWDVILPIYLADWDIQVSGGYDYVRKAREYTQAEFFLGTQAVPQSVLSGGPEDVFTDPNILDPANGFVLAVGGIGTESYLAGQLTDAVYGKFDVTYRGTWRLSAGVRWEDFKQLSVPVDRFQFDPRIGQVSLTDQELLDASFQEDEYYPSIALTWMNQGFLGADDFQVRAGISRTVARPDLREISNAVFIDPLTEARVVGTPGLKTSDIDNYDLRAEWFWNTGDNATISLFYKDISDPIETVQLAGSDDNITLGFINADEGYVYGVELEFLKDLRFAGEWVGDWIDGFFISGNITLSDSQIKVGDSALGLTNDERRLTQHSEWVVNTHLGYDSPDGMHSASLVYNVFGERIFAAGRLGAQDAEEQPIHTLDLVYSFYYTDNLTVKAKIQNILDEQREIETANVITFEQEIGTTASLEVQWQL